MLASLLILGVPFAVQASSVEPCAAANSIPHGATMAQNIAQWLKTDGSKIKTIEEFMCCLPQEYRETYVIAHSSISAQASHYHSPRVIMNVDDVFISVSGGDPSLPQSMSVELMQEDPTSKHLEFYDIDFAGKPHVGPKNSDTCMACHGGTEANMRFGPHPNFDPQARWPRFVRGSTFGKCDGKNDPMPLIDDTSIASLQNPRFKNCLDVDTAASLSTQEANLFAFDSRLNVLNSHRLARVIRATPEYETFKYVIAGAVYCNQNRQNKVRVKDWIPASVMRKMTDMTTLHQEIRKASYVTVALPRLLADEFKAFNASENYLATLSEKIKAGQNPEFRMYQGVVRCQDPAAFPRQLIAKVNSRLQGSPVVDKYIADTYLKATGTASDPKFMDEDLDGQLVGMDPILRYVLESRGISTDTWDMQALPGSYMRDLSDSAALMTSLIDLEPADSLLRQMEKLAYFPISDDETCKQLQKYSMDALSGRTPASSTKAKTANAGGAAAKKAPASTAAPATKKSKRSPKKKTAP